MSKHTPGPWHFDEFFGDANEARKYGLEPTMALDNNGCRFIMSGDCRVALVDPVTQPKRGAGHKHSDLERDANARLIAAAPELLEALELVRDYILTMKGRGHEYQIAVDAAIAKAKGEQ